jgi:flagellar motor protein MotB
LSSNKSIIVKKIKKIEGGHHGGAWKVAYADFVTAMMAFFLLLWLLSMVSDEKRARLSEQSKRFLPIPLKMMYPMLKALKRSLIRALQNRLETSRIRSWLTLQTME